MAYPVVSTLHEWPVHGQIIDLSTASICHVAAGAGGRLIRAYVCLSAAITNSDDVITIKNGSTTLATITITAAASAIGSVHEAVFTGSEAACTFADTGVIVFDNSGASDTTSIGRITAVLRRT